MSESPWFFHSPLPPDGGAVWIDREEARHVVGARRMRPGDAVAFMDGAGGVARGVLSTERDREGGQRVDVSRPEWHARTGRAVTIATAIPKGDRSATIMESMGPLGVCAVTPLACEWSVVSITDNLRTRFQRILIEGCKQSRQAWVPALEAELSPLEAARSLSARGVSCVVLDADGAALQEVLEQADALQGTGASLAPVALFVGPEGGFSPAERENLVAIGARLAALGAGILRVELAAIVAAALARAAALSPPE